MNQDRNERKREHIDFIDEVSNADNCYVNMENLNKNKMHLDEEYQDKLAALTDERTQQNRLYEERIAKLRQDEQYKHDLLQDRMARMVEEKAEHDRKFQEKLTSIQQELSSRQGAYHQKLEHIRVHEVEKDEKHREGVRQLELEKKQKQEEIQAQIDALNLEILKQDKIYEEKINAFLQDQSYKEDVLKSRTAINRDWNDEHGKYQNRLMEIERDRAEVDTDYEEKSRLLRLELENYDKNLQERIARINQERQVQVQLIDDRVAQVQQEKARQDELYRIQLEKLEQDKLYQERMNRLKEDTRETDRLHAESQEHLRREREALEASYLENDNQNRMPTLKRLKEIEDEYEVADKHLDVRGWNVLGNRGENIGRINELIVDTEAMKVRYLDVNVDNSITNEKESRHVLIPIGVATIDQKDDKVVIPTLDRSMVMKCPSYTGQAVTRDYEHTLLTTLSPDYTIGSNSRSDFYNQESFDDAKFYGERKKRKSIIFNK